MGRSYHRLSVLLAGSLLLADSVFGQTMISHTIDGGGGESAADGVTLTGTIGQFDAGLHTSGNVRLEGGFWHAANPLVAGTILAFDDVDFGAVRVNSPSTQEVTIANRGTDTLRIVDLTIGGDAALDYSLTNDACTSAQLAIGSQCTFDVVFTPIERGNRIAQINIQSNARSNPDSLLVIGQGIAPVLDADLSDVVFAATSVGASISIQRSIANAGDADLKLNAFSVTGAHAADFRLVNDLCSDMTLPAGEACTYEIEFAPSAQGARNASVSFSSDALDSPHGFSLSGEGTDGALQLSTGSVVFGEIEVGNTSSSQTVVVSNIGDATITLNALLPVSLPFAIVSENCGESTLNPSDSCSITFAFSPSAVGDFPATLDLSAQDGFSQSSINLSGTGLDGIATPSRASVDFGSVEIATVSEIETAAISNTGNQQLNLGTVQIIGVESDRFELVSDLCSGASIDPGDQCELELRFAPLVTGEHLATLQVSTDTASGQMELALRGVGADPGQLDLSITKSDGVTVVAAGDVLIYEITVINNGPADTDGARIIDTLPAELEDATWECMAFAGASCNVQSGTGNITLDVDLPVGSQVTVLLTAKVAQGYDGSMLINTADVETTGLRTDSDPSNNSATDVNIGDAVFSDGFEFSAVLKLLSVRSTTLSPAFLAGIPDDGKTHIVMRSIARPGIEALVVVQAVRNGDVLQVRLLQQEGRDWQVSPWKTASILASIEVSW